MKDRLAKQRAALAKKGQHSRLLSTTGQLPETRTYNQPRLPVGSFHEHRYLEEGKWAGWLHVPIRESSFVHFTAEARTHLTLIHRLDTQYRAWARGMEAKIP